MTTAPLDKGTALQALPRDKTRASHTIVFWVGFCVTMAALIAAPLVLPEFWRRLSTEILI